MKKKIAIGIAAAALILAAPASQTFTGLITDIECAKGAHQAMNMGPPDAKCVTGCVTDMRQKNAPYDGKESYTLSDQKNAEKFAAKKVMVKGTLDAKTKTIHVDSITAAK